jgi:diguanylate cyclase (GGDEF)-like protein
VPSIYARRIFLTILMPACSLLLFLFSKEVQHYLGSFYASLPYLPYLLIFAAAFLAWGYNNGREFHLLLVIGLSYWGIRQYIWSPNLPIESQSMLFALSCVFIPLNYFLQNLMPEKGIWRWQMLKRLSVSLLQITAVVLLLKYSHSEISQYLRSVLWQNPWPDYVKITQPGLIVIGLCLITIIVQLFIKATVLRSGGLMSLLAMAMALNSVANPSVAMIYFTISAASLLIAVILNSYNLAYLDELTNLPSRRALKQDLLGLGKRYCVAMLDLDYFKKLNDKFGHDVGDQALRMVAAQLNRIPGGGKAYRYGGEEFTLVFRNKETHEVLEHVDNLRKTIAANQFHIRSKKRPRKKPEQPRQSGKDIKVQVTVSIGLAQREEHHNTPQDVIKTADKALYTAKRAGRNCVHAI